jgi:hypothetical protein
MQNLFKNIKHKLFKIFIQLSQLDKSTDSDSNFNGPNWTCDSDYNDINLNKLPNCYNGKHIDFDYSDKSVEVSDKRISKSLFAFSTIIMMLLLLKHKTNFIKINIDQID